jgi:stage II sporulation protein M
MLNLLRELFIGIAEWQSFGLMFFIFLNNSIKCFLVVLLGFMFGIVPFLFITINGFVLGLITFEIEKLIGLPFALAALLPHGIIEIPAVLLSSAIGVMIGYETVRKIKGKGSIKKRILEGTRFYAFRILPLLFLAALIEAFVTPIIINTFF